MIVLDRVTVAEHLPPERAIALVRDGMIALSQGRTRQLLRQILFLKSGDAMGVMPGALDQAAFGAKIVSVFTGAAAQRLPSHQGVVLLFDAATGTPVCLLDAAEITAVRTAAASAAATDALARPGAHRLAILGYGEQAWRHALAMPMVREITEVRVWGRSLEKAQAFCQQLELVSDLSAQAFPAVEDAVQDAGIVCTTTSAEQPILFSSQVADGAHLNVVGSSRAGVSEIDPALVARALVFADHRDSVLSQGAEFLDAKAAGLVDDAHVLGEIGQVYAGALPGRTDERAVTLYKSLGSIVQDLVCAQDLYLQAQAAGFGQVVSL